MGRWRHLCENSKIAGLRCLPANEVPKVRSAGDIARLPVVSTRESVPTEAFAQHDSYGLRICRTMVLLISQSNLASSDVIRFLCWYSL